MSRTRRPVYAAYHRYRIRKVGVMREEGQEKDGEISKTKNEKKRDAV